MMTNRNCNVDFTNLSDKKLMFEFAKVMNFDERVLGNKTNRDNFLIRLLKLPAIIASGVAPRSLREAKPKWLSSDLNELCDTINLSLQEKQAGNVSDTSKKEVIAMADKVLQNKCIYTKQHSILFDLLSGS